LSKELQQKDKIIESLHTKLQQRSDTPCSSHAHSETTDQSDRTSFVSDECRTNEDLELCSDVDAASEYAQEEQGQGARHGPGNTDLHHSLPPPCLKFSSSCPNMLYSTPEMASQTGPVFCSLPSSQSLPACTLTMTPGALSNLPPAAHHQPDHSPFGQITHHAFYPHQLGGRPAGHALKADTGLVENGALWDMENMVEPARVGSSGNNSRNSFTGMKTPFH
ncbi:unnamed protein product, partial [Coregonus sp. 'balchen']